MPVDLGLSDVFKNVFIFKRRVSLENSNRAVTVNSDTLISSKYIIKQHIIVKMFQVSEVFLYIRWEV